MPAIGAFDVPVGAATVEGDEVRIGGWTVRLDPEAGTLTGLVPRALLPVYDVPFTLRRVDALDRPASPAPARRITPRWRAEVGAAVWAGLAARGGRVFVGTDAGSLVVLKEEDGTQVWSYEAGAPLRATPSLHGDALYLHSDDGRIHCLDAATGAPIWSTAVGEAVERIPPGQPGSRYDSYASAVLVAGGAAFVGLHEGGLVALDPGFGTERWRVSEPSSVLATPAWQDGRLYYGTFDGELVARDAATGAEAWRVGTRGAIVSTPTPAGETLVVGNRAYDVLGVRAGDGGVAWKYYYWFSWVESTATLRDGVAYLGSSDARRLQALEAASGRPLWHFLTEGSTWATPAVAAGRVYVGTVGVAGYMVAHEARFHAVDRASGEPAWRWERDRPGEAPLWGFAASPVVGEQGVYAGSLEGEVLAFPF